MSDIPELKQMPAQTVLEIEAEVLQWQVPKLLRTSFETLAGEVARTGNEKAGSPYAQFINMDWETVLNEGLLKQLAGLFRRRQLLCVGIPVLKNIPAKEPVSCHEVDLGQCAVMTHVGPHHLVINTYRALYEWAKERELKLQPRAMEIYVSDPGETKAAELETLVAIPLAT